ncbi:protein tyrosine phosphatase domain-containing protein 1-like isoform X1 [Microplitis mediator]|uniref:protein tyrosine phosphatase domain-containing protein 1-like isoform X1 n=1 Tax=Microplitis mediator TaxID=375433 RepID=UPI00255731B1|nr:protein tyrosine phosphatase domain-containing protein 1-like isoform X1 [Microplitis mediator]
MDVSSLIPAGLRQELDICTVTANYNKLSENFRKLTPIAIQCAIFCGGSRCKYENSAWPPVHMAIRDIFSHWVTDDVLAMARPSTAQLLQKNVISQFKEWSIKTIINLQTPGEHASCGGPLEESGFTYDPSEFMKNSIYYYNFAWKDYDQATVEKLLDMVKVVAFAVQEGRVAIHCHAGLGRTGVLIACYLIYSLRVRASDAIRFVRKKRPGAIQTRGQIKCIKDFEHYILPQMIIFPTKITYGGLSRRKNNLGIFLMKQWNVLHGYEQRTFKYIPKIVFVLCERILQLCNCQDDNSPAEINFFINDTPFTNKFITSALELLNRGKNSNNMRHSFSWAECLSQASFDYSNNSKIETSISSRDTCEDIKRLDDVFCTSPESPSCSTDYPVSDDNYLDDVLADCIHGQDLYDNDCYKEIQSQLLLKTAAQKEEFVYVSIDEVVNALLCDSSKLTDDEKKIFLQYQTDLNNKNSSWQRLVLETNLRVLGNLLYEWLEMLKRPILDMEALSQIVIRGSRPRECLLKFEPCNRYLLEYLLRFVSRLRPLSTDKQTLVIKRIIASLTHQTVWIRGTLMPSDKNFQKLRGGTAGKLMDFFLRFLNLIEEINIQDYSQRSWSSSRWSITSSRLQIIKDMDCE